MSQTETRILSLPKLSRKHAAIVSMPRTAWFWLDDLVSQDAMGRGYEALMDDFNLSTAQGAPEEVSALLKHKAREHCERQMADLYNLANDNQIKPGAQIDNTTPGHPSTPDISARMPCVYQLFRFMPHPTYLTTVWERRYFPLNP